VHRPSRFLTNIQAIGSSLRRKSTTLSSSSYSFCRCVLVSYTVFKGLSHSNQQFLGFAALSGIAINTWIRQDGLGGGLGSGNAGTGLTLNKYFVAPILVRNTVLHFYSGLQSTFCCLSQQLASFYLHCSLFWSERSPGCRCLLQANLLTCLTSLAESFISPWSYPLFSTCASCCVPSACTESNLIESSAICVYYWITKYYCAYSPIAFAIWFLTVLPNSRSYHFHKYVYSLNKPGTQS